MNKDKFNLNWVLINELAVGPAPRNTKHLDFLSSKGIKNVISLCHHDELEEIPNTNEIFNYESFPLPDHKKKVAPNIKDINNVLDRIKDLKKNGPTYVHCFAGVERSPLICIAWLMRESSLDLETSLEYLMKVNPSTCPLKYQLDVLKDL